jgi:putative DNA primase/helicase
MAVANYDDVLEQLRDAGLIIDRGIELDRWVRCRVEGRGREKCGWYRLVEWYSPSGETLIVGSFGVWDGAKENNARKIELPKRDGKRTELTSEQKEAFKRRLAEDRKRIEQLERDKARRASERASKAWAQCSPTGESDYLTRKAVLAHGVRFSPSGALVIPMLDTAGKIHALQVIRSRKVAKETSAPEKQYWPAGAVTKAHFHLIGSPQWILLIAEGYATAATLFEATGYPNCAGATSAYRY